MPLEVQRGCQGNCVFCDIASFYRRQNRDIPVRFHSVEYVFSELRSWYEEGWRSFALYSDNVLAQPDFFYELASRCERDGLRVSFSLSSRPDDILRAREKIAEIAAYRHVRIARVEIGFEAATEKLLRLLGKGTTPEDNEAVFAFFAELAQKTGREIEIGVDFILLAHPEMSFEDLVEQVRFVGRHMPLDQEFAPLVVPYPGTPLHRYFAAKGYEEDPERGFVIPYHFEDPQVEAFAQRLRHLSRVELVRRLRLVASSPDLADRLRYGRW